MEHNGKDEIMVQETEGSTSMISINIKTMGSHTYSILVDKSVPITGLKEQIASVTGVVTEQQRLLFRGKVLEDDQLLSAYYVEDGHTLHLVPLPETLTSDPALVADIQRSRIVGYLDRLRTSLGSLEEAMAYSRPFDGNWFASASSNIERRIRSGALNIQAGSEEYLRVISSSFNEAAGRGNNSSRQASSSEEDAEQGDSTPSPP